MLRIHRWHKSQWVKTPKIVGIGTQHGTWTILKWLWDGARRNRHLQRGLRRIRRSENWWDRLRILLFQLKRECYRRKRARSAIFVRRSILEVVSSRTSHLWALRVISGRIKSRSCSHIWSRRWRILRCIGSLMSSRLKMRWRFRSHQEIETYKVIRQCLFWLMSSTRICSLNSWHKTIAVRHQSGVTLTNQS